MKETNELIGKQLTFQGEALHLMKNIIEREKLPFDVWQEEIDRRGKRPDLIITVLKGSEWKNYCFIEIEDPRLNPYNSSLVESAGNKAFKHGVEYFATWTVNELVLWKSFEVGTPLMQRGQTYFDRNTVGLRVPTYEAALQKRRELNDFLRKFLRHIYDIYVGIERVEKPRPDEVFVRLLRSMVTPISTYASHSILKMYQEDPDFKGKLQEWFVREQMRSPTNGEDIERAARQFAQMLIDKMFFYTVLRPRYRLPDLFIPENDSGEHAREILQDRFERVVKIDYESIFLTNFVDNLPLPDETVPLLSRFTSELEQYDFSDLGYDILGSIFQKLVPREERHVLGQYFTRSDVVDLMAGFCIKDQNAIVLDPACGAGTFLVRSYSRLKNFGPIEHGKILGRLYGVDISKFPAHLSTMNLAARNIGASLTSLNYPEIIHKDFFELTPSAHYKLRGWKGRMVEKLLPEAFDVVITNPPYTRQEEMEKQTFPSGYREKLKKLIEKEWNLPIGKRSSIYSHFFFHGGVFLKEGGRLGLITSNSWLDVDYGKYLQEFFLRNFKIVAVIESKVERWFEDADINTAITILEKCGDGGRMNENLVKFVQLKRPLGEFVLATDDEGERWEAVDGLVSQIENTNEFFEDERIRILAKSQKELYGEGFDEEAKKYCGSKWGKYLRAPDIFFKILERGEDIFVPLKEVAEVRRGFTTGANEFFYLTREEINNWGIEKEFWMRRENGDWVPNYVIKSPRECKSVIVNPKDLKYLVLMIHKDKKDLKGTNVLKYIEQGEERGFHRRPTCASRSRWYELDEIAGNIFWIKDARTRLPVFFSPEGVFCDCRLYTIKPRAAQATKMLAGVLNSTLEIFLAEFIGRQLGGGGGPRDVMTYETAQLLVLNPMKFRDQVPRIPEIFDMISQHPVDTIFGEIGANAPEEVSLGKVKPDRRELDKIIMGEILGLTEDEQLEIYRAVVDLVGSRIERAGSVKRKP